MSLNLPDYKISKQKTKVKMKNYYQIMLIVQCEHACHIYLRVMLNLDNELY